jgi:hypothetical protein
MLAAGLVVAEEKGPLSDLENEDSDWSFVVTVTMEFWFARLKARPELKRPPGSRMYEQFLPLSKILRCDCIQSLRCGVMLAERKKWKLANNVSAELLGNAAAKLGFLS